MSKSGQETEIKLRLADAATGRKLLRRAGFRVAVPRSFERNVIFDTPDALLRSSGMLLRIRSYRGRVMLTLKGQSRTGIYKSRPETETVVESQHAVSAIFQQLGFSPQFRYEKYRTEYRSRLSRGIVLLDETPIGAFLEIEGNPRSIDAAAKALGFSRRDYVTSSYGALYREYCEARNVLPRDMVFGTEDRRKTSAMSGRRKLP